MSTTGQLAEVKEGLALAFLEKMVSRDELWITATVGTSPSALLAVVVSISILHSSKLMTVGASEHHSECAAGFAPLLLLASLQHFEHHRLVSCCNAAHVHSVVHTIVAEYQGWVPSRSPSLHLSGHLAFKPSACVQVRNYYDIAGSVKQILKDLDLDSLNLLLLPADGSMETIRVSCLPNVFCSSCCITA